jgi:hypothetical protein
LKQLIVVFLIIANQAFGQHSPDLKFTPLDTLKIIGDKQFASHYKVVLKTNDPNSLIVKNKEDSTNSMAKKTNQNKWIVYKLPIFEEFINPEKSVPDPDPKFQGEFVTYIKHSVSGQSGIIYYRDDEFIIDVKRHTFLQLTAKSHYENYAPEPKQRKSETYDHYEKRLSQLHNPYTEVNTDIYLDGAYLTLKILFIKNGIKYKPPFRKYLYSDDNESLSTSGVYKYVNGVFVKIKTYKVGFKGLQPMRHSH